MEKLHTNVSIEQLQGMMADLIVSQRESDKKFEATKELLSEKFQATDKKFQATEELLSDKFQATDKQIREMFKELGGIGKSNGEIAEAFFGSALEQNMQIGKLKFDFIDFNTRRKRNNLEAEYDIILYNHYKVLIIEVKYNFRLDHVRDFHTRRLKRFKTLYPEYKKYKLYGAVAALSFEKNVKEEAEKYGFYVLAQNNDKLKVANTNDFVPNEIK